jgi:glycerophosphoryl diester phosphodiesterase
VSFRDWVLWRFRRHAPRQPTAPGAIALAVFWLASQLYVTLPLPRGTVAIQTPHLLGRFSFLNRRFLRAAARRGVAVHVWTIDDEDEMNDVLELGVHGIMTNRPAALAALIRRRAGDVVAT